MPANSLESHLDLPADPTEKPRKDGRRTSMKKLVVLVLCLASVSCAKTLPITKPTYSGQDAAEIVVIRLHKFTGSAVDMYIQIDDEAVCLLPKPGGYYTRFFIKPGRHKFEAVWGAYGTLSEPRIFDIEPNKRYYFRPNNAYWSGKLHIFEISEIDARNLMGLEKYKYIPP